MFDYLRYYLSPFVLLFGIAGLIIGGPYVWMGLATLPILALGDTVLPLDFEERSIRNQHLANIPVIITSAFAFIVYCLLARRAGDSSLSGFNMAGAILSTGWIATIVGIPAFHELFHQRNTFYRNLGRCLQVMYMDATRDIAHLVGHHIDVDTVADHDTARRGQSLYEFGVIGAYRNFVSAQRIESNRLIKQGKGPWSIGHRLWKAIAGLVLFLFIMFMVGGWAGVAACFVATVIARFLLESFNYFQHYGQVRVPGSQIEKRHVWNHLCALSRSMTFEITNHADHHLNSYLPYYALKPDREAVRLPSVFVCFMSALIPPIWHRLIIQPALKEWDLTKATQEERELARAQNQAAGWPDWFDSASTAGCS